MLRSPDPIAEAPWNAERLRVLLATCFNGESIVVLANRQPFQHDRAPGGAKHAAELGQDAVAGGVDEAPAVLADQRQDRGLVALERADRGGLVLRLWNPKEEHCADAGAVRGLGLARELVDGALGNPRQPLERPVDALAGADEQRVDEVLEVEASLADEPAERGRSPEAPQARERESRQVPGIFARVPLPAARTAG